MSGSQANPPTYLDFELEIGLGQGREYPLVARSPAGEARATLVFPFDKLALESHLKDLHIALLSSGGRLRQVLTSQEQAVRNFGSRLFEALFTGEVGRLYAACQQKAETHEQGVRLRLRIQAPELAVLPWEYLYDERQKNYVCLSTQTPVVRYIDAPLPISRLAVAPPLRILGMIADPESPMLERLDVQREKERLERALRGMQGSQSIELHWLESPTWRALQKALRAGPWHIFHFIGHGGFDSLADEGLIIFEDQAHQPHPMRASELAGLLVDHRSLRLVVLNACQGAMGSQHDLFSSTAAILSRCRIPAVIAMQHKITDDAAIELAQVFYETLMEGLPVEKALAEARKAVKLAVTNTLEWGTPVLYLRAADGVLFSVQPSAISSQLSAVSQQPQEALARARPAVEMEPAPPPVKPAAPDGLTVTLASGLTMEFVRIPAGEFWMGSDKKKDPQAYGDDLPQHKVFLDEYYLAKYPVTNRQYQAFVQAAKVSPPSHWKNGVIPQGKEQHPVVKVSWQDAQAFCSWASQVSGEKIALPSEAQWEKAARSSDGRIYPWGEAAPDAQLCNFNRNVNDTTPVGQYSPRGDSPYGCADMAGNVWEWCADWYEVNEYQQRAKEAVHNPSGPASGYHRVLRGGAWNNVDRYVRTANRSRNTPTYRGNDIGFRCSRSP